MAIFYIIEVSVLGFTVYFLNQNGYTSSEIGILLAVFGIVAAIRQPLLGHIADKNSKVDFKVILTFSSLIVVVLFILLYYFDKNKIVIGIIFGMIFIFTSSMSPFVNESCFYYKRRGINVNFGIARGFGSFSFAVFSYLLGVFTNDYGSKVIAFSGIISAVLFFIVVLLLPRVENRDSSAQSEIVANDVSANKSNSNLIKKYPSFFMVVLATIFAICFQNADCGYLINIIENLGGNSSHLGIANAIAAMAEIPIMFLITRIIKKIRIKKLILIACAFYIVRGLIFCISNMAAVYIAQLLQMFTYAIIIPSTVYLSDEMMQNEDKNKGQAFIGMAVTIGLILGSLLGGQLVSIGGVNLLKKACIIIAVISFIFAMLGNAMKEKGRLIISN